MAEPTEESVARLRRIEGQVRGLQRMLAESRPYEEVITQFMATRAALDKVGISLVSQHIQDCTRRQSAGKPCEAELERALGLFLRMDARPDPEALADDAAVVTPRGGVATLIRPHLFEWGAPPQGEAFVATAVAVSDSTFETEVLKSETPVLVDFWATWCGPCRALAPTVDAVAQENTGKLKVVKLDVDANQQAALRYGVMSIPTLILFKHGQEVARLVGNQPKSALVRELGKHLG